MIINRWTVLLVLFTVRFGMGFQFQTVAALSPSIMESYLVDLADIGLLIGLYLGPGILFALPGGAVATRFGDKPVILAALGLMLLGGAMVFIGPSWGWLLAGRIFAGVGGVAINVLLTKMLIDWFAGREIGTAMAVFVSSWPAGLAAALLVLPGLELLGGLALAWVAPLAVIGFGLILFLVAYRSPPGVEVSASSIGAPQGMPWRAITHAGLVWALYNTAMIILVGFGPVLLVDRSLSPAEAATTVSAFIIAAGISIPFGGVISDKTGRRDMLIVVSMLSLVGTLALTALVPLSYVAIILGGGGILAGLCAGPVMSLPSLVLSPDQRAFGMGVFFTIYYIAMLVGPTLAGELAERTGVAAAPFAVAVLIALGALLALDRFRRELSRNAAPI